MELIAVTFMKDKGGDSLSCIRAIRTTIPINCIIRTLSWWITEEDLVVVFAPKKTEVNRITEH